MRLQSPWIRMLAAVGKTVALLVASSVSLEMLLRAL